MRPGSAPCGGFPRLAGGQARPARAWGLRAVAPAKPRCETNPRLSRPMHCQRTGSAAVTAGAALLRQPQRGPLIYGAMALHTPSPWPTGSTLGHSEFQPGPARRECNRIFKRQRPTTSSSGGLLRSAGGCDFALAEHGSAQLSRRAHGQPTFRLCVRARGWTPQLEPGEAKAASHGAASVALAQRSALCSAVQAGRADLQPDRSVTATAASPRQPTSKGR